MFEMFGGRRMKLALVCKLCDELTWRNIDYMVINTDRRYYICQDCITESNEQAALHPEQQTLWHTLQD